MAKINNDKTTIIQYNNTFKDEVASKNNANNNHPNSVLEIKIPEYAEVVEDKIEEEPIPGNFMENTVTKNDIDEQLLILAKQIGLELNDVKKLTEDILNDIDGLQGRTLYEITNRQLTIVISAIKNAYFSVKENNSEINFEDIKQKTNDNIKAFLKVCYNFDFYENVANKYNNKNIFEYIAEAYPDLAKEDAIKMFAKNNIHDVIEKRIANGESKDVVIKEIKNELFVIIEMLETDEEKIDFLNVVKYAGAGYVTDLCEVLITELNSDESREVLGLQATSIDFLKDIAKEDVTGKFNAGENSRRILEATDGKVAVNVANFAKDSYQKHCIENQEALDEINKKLANGEELTEEEQELLRIHELHVDTNAGTTVGINNHKEISKDQKDYITAQILKVFEENKNLNEISQKIAEIVLSNPEAFDNTSIKELTDRLDNLTNGNYSKIANEVKSNQEIKNLISAENKDAQKQNDIGFTTKENNKLPKIENIQNQIKAYTIEEDSTPRLARNSRSTTPIYTPLSTLKDYVQNEGAYKGFKSYARDFGFFKAIIETLKKPEKVDKTQIKKEIKKQNTINQTKIIQASGVSTIDLLLEWVRNDAIQKLKGTILRTNFATKALKEKNKEIQEDKAHA